MEGLKRVERFIEVRAGEALSFWRRTQRVFENGSQWYFRTREGIDVGPYRTRFEAEVEADLLKHQLQSSDADDAETVIRTFMLESVHQGVLSDQRDEFDGLRAHWHADIGVLAQPTS